MAGPAASSYVGPHMDRPRWEKVEGDRTKHGLAGGTGLQRTKKEGANGPFLEIGTAYFFFAALGFAPLAAFEALKLRDFEAAILMGAPVWGLRPVRALRLF